MNRKKIIIVISIGILVLLGFLTYSFFASKTQVSVDTPHTDRENNPFPTPNTQTLTLPTRDGRTLSVPNFLTARDVNRVEGADYPLYELNSGVEEVEEKDFSIHFSGDYGYFNVVLYGEDLLLSRLRAEEYLSRTLGISQYNLCFLNYSVGVTLSVNEELAAYDNLGFSQCPGSVSLK